MSEHFDLIHRPWLNPGTKVEIIDDIETHGIFLKRGTEGFVTENIYCCCDHLTEESLKIKGIIECIGVPFNFFRIKQI